VLTLGGTGLWRTIWRELCNDRLAVTVNGGSPRYSSADWSPE
jgi:hypothetical protein